MKMKKSTDDLMKILRSTPSVDEYFDRNDSEIFFGSLSELIDFYLARKKLTKADVVRNSGMNRGYCYEIMAGKTTKNISRDKVIMLCFGLNLTVDAIQGILSSFSVWKITSASSIQILSSESIILRYWSNVF